MHLLPAFVFPVPLQCLQRPVPLQSLQVVAMVPPKVVTNSRAQMDVLATSLKGTKQATLGP